MVTFNDIPEEIKDKIFKIYWRNIFYEKVIKELEQVRYTIDKINSYMIYHGKNSIIHEGNKPIIEHHRYYYMKHNNYIKKLLSKKATQKLLCNIINKNQITINIWIWHECLEKISNDYKYLALYYIMNKDKVMVQNQMEYNNDKIIKYFSIFSKYKPFRSNSI